MKKSEIAILSFKVLSIYAVIQSIYQVYNFLYFLSYQKQLETGEKYNLLLAFIPSLLMILCAIILWFGAPILASKIFKDDKQKIDTSSSYGNLQSVAFSVVGLFLLSTSLPAVVEVVLVTLVASDTTNSIGALTPAIVEIILKVTLGTWLLFGSQGFVNFLMYMNGKREKF